MTELVNRFYIIFMFGFGIDMKCRKGEALVRSIATHRLERQNFFHHFQAFASQNALYIPFGDVQKCAVGVFGDCGLGFL